ncbi:MAG: hypothetical protein E7348_01740 [Clostridiales bacterium]|nr:hypothetical protein [Clostridiales bacterium]
MKKAVIFGDSYSTFDGYIPNGYAPYYPGLGVDKVEKTWWGILAKKYNLDIVQNNSWSGSTIGYTGYENTDCSKDSSFIYRYRLLKQEGFFEKNDIDTIFVFGGTNDSWSNAPLGEYKLNDWQEKDLYNVLPAICYFAHILKSDFPNTQIIFIINSDIKEEIQNYIQKVAKHYDAKSVLLENIEKEGGHPNQKGMEQMANQIEKVLI